MNSITWPATRFLMVCLLSSGIGMPSLAPAQDTASGVPPAAPSLDEGRIRDAITRSVIALRLLANKDENRFFLAPISTKKVVDWKEIDVNYVEKEVDVPIYEEYKTREAVTSMASDQTSTKLQEVTKHRVAGYKKELRLIRDRAGTIIKKEKWPVYGPGGREHLPAGFWGQNGMVLYTMLKCGVPASDPQFVRSSSRLLKFTEVYGLPDRTWDLAWLTAAAVNLPRTLATKAITERLVNKLLLAQIKEGAAAGMWGPVAVNTDLFAAMLTYEFTTSQKEVAPAEEQLKKDPESYRLIKKLSEVQDKVKQIQEQYPEVTTLGMMFDRAATGIVNLKPNSRAFYASEDGDFLDATSIGWPHYIVKEQTADLQCTALALFALKEAARNKWLPTTTTVPKLPTGQGVIPAENTSSIILRSLAALARLQKEKPLSEGNIWMPTHDFDKLGLAGLPVDDKLFLPVASPVTSKSTGETYAALENASVLGGQQAAAQLAPFLTQARDAAIAVAQNLPAVDAQPLPDDTVSTPCDVIYALQPALARAGTTPEAQATRTKLTNFLLTLQRKEGVWIPRPKYPWRTGNINAGLPEEYETSVIARINVVGLQDTTTAPTRPGEVKIPFNAETRSWREKPFFLRNVSLSMKPEVTSTCYAVLSLAWMLSTSNPAGNPPPVLLDWPTIEKVQMPDESAEAAAAAPSEKPK